MIKFKFNEINDMEDVAYGKNLSKFTVHEIINMLARYNYFIRELEYETNRQNIKSFIDAALSNVDMNEFANVVSMAVKNAPKHPISNVNEIIITKNEIEIIKSLNDIKQEKILFVILAIAKYNYIIYDGKYGYAAFCKYSDLFKMARVTVPIKDRAYFMQFVTQTGLIEIPNSPATISLKPTFVDNDSKCAIKLGEVEFKDLAYAYMAYKEPHKFRRCTTCGKYFRRKKDENGNEVQKCRDCKSMEHTNESNVKRKICENCGAIYIKSTKDNVSTMCETCYNEHRKIKKAENMRNIRHKE